GNGSLDVQAPGEEPVTIAYRLVVAAAGAAEERPADEGRVGHLAALVLQTEQEGGDAGNHRRRTTGAGAQGRAAARARPAQVFAGGQEPVALVGAAPVAEVERPAVRVHGADGQDGGERGGHVGARTAVVADG